MAALLLHRPARGLALGILHQHAALSALDEADEQGEADREADDPEHHGRIHRAGATAFEQLGDAARHGGDDPGHDDQADPVTDPAAGDLLADPHQEQGAANQADGRGDAEHHSRLDHRANALRRGDAFQPDGDEIALHRGEEDGQVAGILVELLAPGLALFLERLPTRVHRCAQLHHDRRGDVGHHAERDD